MLKSDEVAALLRVHPKQVYRMLAKGLPARRVGAEWRFVREDVLAWSETRGERAEVAATRAASASMRGKSAAPPLVAANGDVVVELLLEHARRDARALVGLVVADRGVGLEHLAEARVLATGFHGALPPSFLASARLARLHLVSREIGLAYVRGRLARLADLKGCALLRARLRGACVRGGARLALGRRHALQLDRDADKGAP